MRENFTVVVGANNCRKHRSTRIHLTVVRDKTYLLTQRKMIRLYNKMIRWLGAVGKSIPKIRRYLSFYYCPNDVDKK